MSVEIVVLCWVFGWGSRSRCSRNPMQGSRAHVIDSICGLSAIVWVKPLSDRLQERQVEQWLADNRRKATHGHLHNPIPFQNGTERRVRIRRRYDGADSETGGVISIPWPSLDREPFNDEKHSGRSDKWCDAHINPKPFKLMRTRPCISCDRLTKTGSRCPQHANAQGRNSHPALQNPRMETNLPEIGHPPHRTSDLVVDHIRPLLQGGTNHSDNLRVICCTANTLRAQQPRLSKPPNPKARASKP